MSAPKRVQRMRTKGWRMPEGAVYVGRPTKWGNPYLVPFVSLERSLALFENSATGVWSGGEFYTHESDEFVSFVYRMHTAWTRRMDGHPLEAIRTELAGRDLACWCPLDQPCHADVLLELANGVVS